MMAFLGRAALLGVALLLNAPAIQGQLSCAPAAATCCQFQDILSSSCENDVKAMNKAFSGFEFFCKAGSSNIYFKQPAKLNDLNKAMASLGASVAYRGVNMQSSQKVCDTYPYQNGHYLERFKIGCDHYDKQGGMDKCIHYCNTHDAAAKKNSATRAACRNGCAYRDCTDLGWIQRGCNQANPKYPKQDHKWHNPEVVGGAVPGNGDIILQYKGWKKGKDGKGDNVCPVDKIKGINVALAKLGGGNNGGAGASGVCVSSCTSGFAPFDPKTHCINKGCTGCKGCAELQKKCTAIRCPAGKHCMFASCVGGAKTTAGASKTTTAAPKTTCPKNIFSEGTVCVLTDNLNPSNPNIRNCPSNCPSSAPCTPCTDCMTAGSIKVSKCKAAKRPYTLCPNAKDFFGCLGQCKTSCKSDECVAPRGGRGGACCQHACKKTACVNEVAKSTVCSKAAANPLGSCAYVSQILKSCPCTAAETKLKDKCATTTATTTTATTTTTTTTATTTTATTTTATTTTTMTTTLITCSAGEKVGSDNTCEACQPSQGEFQDADAHSSRDCKKAQTICPDSQHIGAAATAKTDLVCTAHDQCTDTQYESKAPTTTTGRECAALATCTAGKYVTVPASATADRKCKACPHKQFQDKENQKTCKDMTLCGEDQFMSKAGTPASDRECSACPAGTEQPKDNHYEDGCIDTTTTTTTATTATTITTTTTTTTVTTDEVADDDDPFSADSRFAILVDGKMDAVAKAEQMEAIAEAESSKYASLKNELKVAKASGKPKAEIQAIRDKVERTKEKLDMANDELAAIETNFNADDTDDDDNDADDGEEIFDGETGAATGDDKKKKNDDSSTLILVIIVVIVVLFAVGAAAGTYLLKKGQGAPAEPLSFTNPAYASGGAGMGSFAAAEPTYASAESAHAPASAPTTGYMDVAPGSTTGYMDVAPGPLAQVAVSDAMYDNVAAEGDEEI